MPQREILKPQFDVPLMIRLDQGPEGKEVSGKFAVEYQYTVNRDTGVMWLPKEGRAALLQSGAKAGDEVQLVKSMRGKTVLFSAEVVSDAKEPAKPPAVNGGFRADVGNAAPIPESKYVQPVTLQLAGALCAAIDAVSEAQTYATNKGLHLQFSADDVRAIALSVYIGNQKRT